LATLPSPQPLHLLLLQTPQAKNPRGWIVQKALAHNTKRGTRWCTRSITHRRGSIHTEGTSSRVEYLEKCSPQGARRVSWLLYRPSEGLERIHAQGDLRTGGRLRTDSVASSIQGVLPHRWCRGLNRPHPRCAPPFITLLGGAVAAFFVWLRAARVHRRATGCVKPGSLANHRARLRRLFYRPLEHEAGHHRSPEPCRRAGQDNEALRARRNGEEWLRSLQRRMRDATRRATLHRPRIAPRR
jgi:hypothetical protein